VTIDRRLGEAIDEFRAELGLDFAAARRVLCKLAGGVPLTVSALVAETGASRHTVTDLLSRLGEWIERADDGCAFRSGHAAPVRAALDCATVPMPGFDRADLGLPQLARLTEMLGAIGADRPPARWELDHVAATPDTAARRAHALSANFDLAGRHVLCLGDHDLTSVALTLLVPDLEVTVVDVDEPVLAHVSATANRHGLPIRTAFADLRAELPPSTCRTADLVFTDPPYTPAGIELFLARGLAALRRRPDNRIVFCYSPNDRQPARALAVQEVLGRLRLAIEAVLPGFNVFAGAESLGGRSALWVCQPTRTTWPAIQRHRPQTRIYTRGRHAEETHAESEDGRVAEILRRHADGLAVSIPADQLLRTEPPAGQGGVVRPGGALLVDLTAVHASYVHRILLRGPAIRRAVFVANARDLRRTGLVDPADPVRRLISARFSLAFPRERGTASDRDLAVVVAEAVPAEEVPADLAIARYVLDHPKAKLAGAWREALVAQARQRGETLTKNDAREAIGALVDPAAFVGRYVCELPSEVLVAVAVAIAPVA
jgi:hypothetical protein